MGAKFLADANGNLQFLGTILDQSSIISIDANNRLLKFPNGTIAANYSTNGIIDFNNSNFINVGSIAPSTPIPPSWINVTSSTVSLMPNYNYSISYASQVSAEIPTTAAYGSEIKICDVLGNGFLITQPVGVYIITKTGNTTPGITGSIQSSGYGSSIYLSCVVANTVWQVINSEGVFTTT